MNNTTATPDSRTPTDNRVATTVIAPLPASANYVIFAVNATTVATEKASTSSKLLNHTEKDELVKVLKVQTAIYYTIYGTIMLFVWHTFVVYLSVSQSTLTYLSPCTATEFQLCSWFWVHVFLTSWLKLEGGVIFRVYWKVDGGVNYVSIGMSFMFFIISMINSIQWFLKFYF